MQRITKLSPGEATTEAAQALAAAGIAGCTVSSSPQTIGRQGKVFLVTTVCGDKGRHDAGALLDVMQSLPDVTIASTMGRGTAYIYRRLI